MVLVVPPAPTAQLPVCDGELACDGLASPVAMRSVFGAHKGRKAGIKILPTGLQAPGEMKPRATAPSYGTFYMPCVFVWMLITLRW